MFGKQWRYLYTASKSITDKLLKLQTNSCKNGIDTNQEITSFYRKEVLARALFKLFLWPSVHRLSFEIVPIMFIDKIDDRETIREGKYWRSIMETLIKHVLLLCYQFFINILFLYHYIFIVINMVITILTIIIIFVNILNIIFIILPHYH